ncbi:MAG TPA: hypothetical protein VJH23_02960 [archaeon]|nr:hypothetical protein [archaeon]
MPKSFWDNLKWLDPFTYVDKYLMPVVNPKGDKLIENIVYVLSALIFAYVLYNFVLAGLLGTSAPLVIVYSGSMEPVLYRGDVAILTGSKDFTVAQADVDFPVGGKRLSDFAEIGYAQNEKYGLRQAALKINGNEYRFDPQGPIVVYYSQLRGQDIIHRAVLKLHAPDGDFLITMGDNNSRIDIDCPSQSTQCITLSPVPVEKVRGKYLFHIPLIGYAKLIIFDDLPKLLGGSQ